MQIYFKAVGIDVLHALEVVDELQAVAVVGHRIACGIAELPLTGVLADGLVLEEQPGADVMAAGLELIDGAGGDGARGEQVAGVLHIGANTELLAGVGVVEPVLSLDVVGLALLGGEGGGADGEGAAAAELACQRQGTEHGAEEVLLLAVEIDAEALDILHGAEVGLAVLGLEAVFVVRDIADRVQAPLVCGLPREVGLVVDEGGVVLAIGLQGAEEIAVGLEAEALREGDLAHAEAVIDAGAEEAGADTALVALWAFVGDIEDGRHAVAVLGLEAAGGELYALHHIGVDDGESLLLAAADEHGAVDLDAVDIDAVLIEGAAADVVLRGELVVCGDTGLRGYELLDGIAGGGGHPLQVLGGEFLCGTHLAAHLADDDLAHVCAAVAQGDIPCEAALRAHEELLLLLVADEGVVDDHAVGGIEVEGVLAVEPRDAARHLALDLHGDKGQRLLVLVDDTAADVAGRGSLLGGGIGRSVRSRHDGFLRTDERRKQTGDEV